MKMMHWLSSHWPFAFLMLVGIVNIVLNWWVYRAANNAQTYGSALFSKDFAVAFLVGSISILCLLLAYKNWPNLSSGILLMGATSVLGGTLWGVFWKGNRLSVSEWGIFVCIAAFYLYRAMVLLMRGLSK